VPTNHSNKGRRHRGRRGRRSGNREEPQVATQEVAGESTPAGGAPPEPVVQQAEEVTSAPPRQQRRPPNASRGRGDARPGGQRQGGRRRNQQRQVAGPMPKTVLKHTVEIVAPSHARESRSVSSMTGTDAANFGCPMLSRIVTRMPATGFQNAPRCSMAWAIHNEEEALLCMYTADMLDCWKAHPEKIEGLQAHIAQDAEAAAAD